MCGISVAISKGSAREAALQMLRHVAHRGITDFETHATDNIALGAIRLPISSRPSDKQPLVSPSGRYLMVFNGEYYSGNSFDEEGGSDGLCLLRQLERHGVRSLTQVNSIHACAILDRKNDQVILSRDHIGVKPLYYSHDLSSFFACSEIKGLVNMGGNVEISTVLPGQLLSLSLRENTLRVVARNPSYEKQTQVDCQVGHLRDLLVDSVRLRCMNAPGPLGVYLSGGVDSSAVLSIAMRFRDDVVAIIGGRPGDLDHDVATVLADSLSCPYVVAEVPREEELFDLVPKLVEITESYEPNMIRQSAAQFAIARAGAEAGCRVVLCGEGADELFCGYPDFQKLGRTNDWRRLRFRFLHDLHRTQLQRLDRLAMHFTTEARAPMLDRRLVALALSIEEQSRLFDYGADRSRNKLIFRDAMSGLLPDSVRTREKIVLSEGVGLAGNHPTAGMFFARAAEESSEVELADFRARFPKWTIRNLEEAFYFRYFLKAGYCRAAFLRERSATNLVHSIQRTRRRLSHEITH